MKPLNDLQHRVLAFINAKQHLTLTHLGALYYSKEDRRCIGRLAALSIARMLERQGLVVVWRSSTGDRWASLYVSPTAEGTKLLYAPRRP